MYYRKVHVHMHIHYTYVHTHILYVCSIVIALLRKYYSSLLDCFSDDHITTIGLLSETVSLREGFFEEVIAYTDPREANERILNAIINNMERNDQLLRACELIKALIGSKQYSEVFLEFETGK